MFAKYDIYNKKIAASNKKITEIAPIGWK